MVHKIKHKEANKALHKLSEKHGNKDTAKKLAVKFGVSSQTILNYLHGMGSDGYLKDAIILDLSTPKEV